jgi:hypothetical protein
MTNHSMIYGTYQYKTPEDAITLEGKIKDTVADLFTLIDSIPNADISIINAAKMNIVTGMMWAIKQGFEGHYTEIMKTHTIQ